MASCLEKDLSVRNICNALGSIKTRWFEFGVQLGIPRSKLLEFKEGPDPLSAVVDYWLNGNAIAPVSWKSIVATLKSDYINEPGLAQKISIQYCKCRDQEDKAKPEGDSFATDQPSSKSPTDSDITMDLEYILEENLSDITSKYASYVHRLCSIVDSKGESPESLRLFLLSLSSWILTEGCQKLTSMSEKKSDLQKCNTIIEIFTFLSTECASFLNYEIFQEIVAHYDIRDGQICQYGDHLKAYIEKHKISEFARINPLSKQFTERSKKMILKFDVENTCRLARIVKLKKSVSKILKIHPSDLQIIDIKDGCVIVTFSIPASLADELFKTDTIFSSKQEDDFETAKVLWLKCNGITFDFGSDKQDNLLHTDQIEGAKMNSGDYYDILLIGRTGQGKSTFGNKLLSLDDTPESKIHLFESFSSSKQKRFVQADDADALSSFDDATPVTSECVLLANVDTSIRVLDVPGFSIQPRYQRRDKSNMPLLDEKTLKVVHSVQKTQILSQMKIRRIVYFLPLRGPLEKADGIVTNELKMLRDAFGKEIFDCMVVAATMSPSPRYQRIGFDEGDLQETQRSFQKSLRLTIPNETIFCPSIIYVGLHDKPSDCLSKIIDAPVLNEGILPLNSQDYDCQHCSVKIRCSKENEEVAVVYPDGTLLPHAQSKCHVAFIQKWSVWKGAARMFGFGSQVSNKESWPGYIDSDVCIECKKPIKSMGCTTVQCVKIYGEGKDMISVTVKHSRKSSACTCYFIVNHWTVPLEGNGGREYWNRVFQSFKQSEMLISVLALYLWVLVSREAHLRSRFSSLLQLEKYMDMGDS